MEDQAPRKILTLRRMGGPLLNSTIQQDDMIRKNLQPLKENVEKKKRAQEAYYQNSSAFGTSPMTRELHKAPVQQRLGRKVPFTGTNSSMVPPKKRLYKNSTLNNSVNKNKKKSLKRNNYAQMRLNNIRERQRQSLADNNSNLTKRIKLRRLLPNASTPNFKVQVRNNGAFGFNGVQQAAKRHKIVLDSEIQIAINQLQNMYCGETLIINKITPKATNIYLNDRFGILS